MKGQFYAHVEMLTGVDNIFQCYYSVGLLNPGLLVLYVEFQIFQLIEIFPIYYGRSEVHLNNCPKTCNTKQSIYYSASSLYMFRVSTTPIIRNTQNCNYSLWYLETTSLQRGQAWPRWREVAAQKIWPVPEAVVTVLCTPDDGCGWYPKHVEWTCRIINRLLCVESRWTIIDINI